MFLPAAAQGCCPITLLSAPPGHPALGARLEHAQLGSGPFTAVQLRLHRGPRTRAELPKCNSEFVGEQPAGVAAVLAQREVVRPTFEPVAM